MSTTPNLDGFHSGVDFDSDVGFDNDADVDIENDMVSITMSISINDWVVSTTPHPDGFHSDVDIDNNDVGFDFDVDNGADVDFEDDMVSIPMSISATISRSRTMPISTITSIYRSRTMPISTITSIYRYRC